MYGEEAKRRTNVLTKINLDYVVEAVSVVTHRPQERELDSRPKYEVCSSLMSLSLPSEIALVYHLLKKAIQQHFLFVVVRLVLRISIVLLMYYVADSGLLDYMPRHGWGAVSPKIVDPPLKRPVKMVGVFHTALVKDKCMVTDNCCEIIKSMQTSAMKGIFEFFLTHRFII